MLTLPLSIVLGLAPTAHAQQTPFPDVEYAYEFESPWEKKLGFMLNLNTANLHTSRFELLRLAVFPGGARQLEPLPEQADEDVMVGLIVEQILDEPEFSGTREFWNAHTITCNPTEQYLEIKGYTLGGHEHSSPIPNPYRHGWTSFLPSEWTNWGWFPAEFIELPWFIPMEGPTRFDLDGNYIIGPTPFDSLADRLTAQPHSLFASHTGPGPFRADAVDMLLAAANAVCGTPQRCLPDPDAGFRPIIVVDGASASASVFEETYDALVTCDCLHAYADDDDCTTCPAIPESSEGDCDECAPEHQTTLEEHNAQLYEEVCLIDTLVQTDPTRNQPKQLPPSPCEPDGLLDVPECPPDEPGPHQCYEYGMSVDLLPGGVMEANLHQFGTQINGPGAFGPYGYTLSHTVPPGSFHQPGDWLDLTSSTPGGLAADADAQSAEFMDAVLVSAQEDGAGSIAMTCCADPNECDDAFIKVIENLLDTDEIDELLITDPGGGTQSVNINTPEPLDVAIWFWLPPRSSPSTNDDPLPHPDCLYQGNYIAYGEFVQVYSTFHNEDGTITQIGLGCRSDGTVGSLEITRIP